MRGRRPLVIGLMLAVLTASCIELSVDPNQLSSIEFVPPTNPSIVVGDTLRDSLGNPERLRARAFSADGDEIPDVSLAFVSTDTLVSVATDGIVKSRGTLGTTRLYATVAGLQSAPRSLEVIRRPDSIAPNGAERDTVLYRVVGAGGVVDSSTSVGVIVRSGTTPVNAVRVRFEIVRGGRVLAPTDTAIYALAGTQGRVSAVDTTDGSGIASRTLRVRVAPGTTLRDTVVVRASAVIGRTPLKGNPAVVTVVVLPAS